MVLIIGGAYQGKLDYAKEKFALEDAQIQVCINENIDFQKICISALEEFTYSCVKQKTDPVALFQENREKWENSILICQDLFCGVVPMDAQLRDWRQTTGRLCQYLAGEAESVYRIFCGLEQKLK